MRTTERACDRCGIELTNDPDESNGPKCYWATLRLRSESYHYDDGMQQEDHTYDLCAVCKKKFWKWLDAEGHSPHHDE